MYTNLTSRGRFLAGLVVVSLLVGIALTGAAAAQSTTTNGTATNGTMGANGTANVSLTADTASAGATTNHSLNATLSDTLSGNLTEASINYTAANASTGAVLGDTDNISITVGNHSVADQNVSISSDARENVTVSAPNFRLVNFSFTGNQSFALDTGDSLHFQYLVQNPTDAGNYTVPLVLASSENDTLSMNATLDVTPNQTAGSGGSMGSENVSLAAEPATAGALANHSANLTVSDALSGNLTGASINYTAANASTGAVLGDTDNITITVGNHSVADQNVSISSDARENVTVSAPDFHLVNFSFTGNQSFPVEVGDHLGFQYSVQNPSEAGNYTVPVVLASSENDTLSMNATLDVTPNQTTATPGTNGTSTTNGTTQTTTMESNRSTSMGTTGSTSMGTTQSTSMATTQETTAADTTQEATTETTESGGATTTSSGNGPGFTTFAGLVGIIAVALLALRRN